MPRKPRFNLNGILQHVILRGNNREIVFVEPGSYKFYLDLWKDCTKRYGVVVYAYCLMTNHIHFLVTPRLKGAGPFNSNK